MIPSKIIKMPDPKTLDIDNLRGADYYNNPGATDLNRSPDMLNMVSDKAGRPVKRPGYVFEELRGLDWVPAPINGIFAHTGITGIRKILLHAGTRLYWWKRDDEAVILLRDGLAENRSMAFEMEGKLWILDGKEYLVFDPTDDTVRPVSEIAYVPTTTINASPNGNGRKEKEAINMLSSARINEFLSDGTERMYKLDAENITAVTKCEQLNADGTWSTITGYIVYTGSGNVYFNTAPPVSPVLGADNIRITYTKTNEDNLKKINSCTLFAKFGVGGENRVFFSGNPDYPNYDYSSATSTGSNNAAAYFPETNFLIVGSDSNPIMGYLNIGEYQAILKEDRGEAATVFLRAGELDNDGKPMFPIKQGIAGVGAISRFCFKNLRDDRLFLSSQGVFAVQTNAITAERNIQQRSDFINRPLLNDIRAGGHPVAYEKDGYLYIAVNGHVYVADANIPKSYVSKNIQEFQYEWYNWDNLPVRVWASFDLDDYNNSIMFGTEDGKIGLLSRNHSTDNGEPIKAYWTTPEFEFDTYTLYKTLKRMYLKLNPSYRSDVDIYFKINGGWQHIDSKHVDLFSFFDIDFNRFSFNTDSNVNIVMTKVKKKKIVTLQMRFSNDTFSNFGLYSVALVYQLKNKNKGTTRS